MTYTYQHGIRKDGVGRSLYAIFAVTAALLVAFGVFVTANATSGPVGYTTTLFTPGEVAMWSPDRTAPTGGYESTAFGGRGDVLEMKFVGADQSPTPFYQTEGLQRDIPDSDSIKADVYVDAAWGSQTVRAGLWGVAHDESDAISSYPIIEYTTDGFVGWRYWDVDHWVNLAGVTANVGAWNTLEITHDTETDMFVYRVNGSQVATATDEDSMTISAAILNSKNYGADYAARWSNFAYGNVLPTATSKEACKAEGWKMLYDKNGAAYQNQGQCVASVVSNEKSKLNR